MAAAGLTAGATTGRAVEAEVYRAKNGRILQSVVPWCFRPMTLEELFLLESLLSSLFLSMPQPTFLPLFAPKLLFVQSSTIPLMLLLVQPLPKVSSLKPQRAQP